MASEIIGVAGMSASGKDSAAEYLSSRHGYLHVATGDIVKAYGLEHFGTDDQYVMRKAGHEIRQKFGKAGLCQMALEQYTQKSADYEGLVVSGIRAMPAAEFIRLSGGLLVFVDAPVEERFKRLRRRNRTGESSTLEEFVAFESQEFSGELQTGQNLAGIKEISDRYIFNDFPDCDTYLQAFEEAVGLTEVTATSGI